DEFRKKLELYEKGELPENEAEAFEKDLEKLESYQEYLIESQSDDTLEVDQNTNIDEKKQKRILRRSKWKARFQTAL
ncbi:hypothetical protein, partial [Pseudomonas sp. 2995-3]|uniref:hypothetical protein n=1 Tax=Pseudomonas sp. 2995-3 TaxID=1712680 RepID=UPI000C41F20E